MNEIATVMNEEEFGYFLKSFEKKADLKSLSMISRRCQVVDTLCGLQSDTVLTVGQIKQLFELAKIKKRRSYKAGKLKSAQEKIKSN